MTDAETESDSEIPDPEEVQSNWNGVVRKIWLDEMPDDEAFVDHDNSHYHGPYTLEEQRQLETHGKSVLQVKAAEYPTVLRVIYVRDELVESVEDEIQVFAVVFDDGRKKDRIYYRPGVSAEDVLEREANNGLITQPITNHREREGVTVDHLGSFAEYRENAEQYEYDFIGQSTVPKELMRAVGPHEPGRIKERASA